MKQMYILSIITPGREGQKDNFFEVAKLWPMEGKDGFSGVSAFGRVILKPVDSNRSSGGGNPRREVAADMDEFKKSFNQQGGAPFDDDIPFASEWRG